MKENWLQYYSECFNHTLYPPIICDLPSYGKIYDTRSILYKTGKAFSKKIDGKSEEWGFDSLMIHKENTFPINYILENLLLLNTSPKISITDFIVADRDSIVFKHLLTTYGKNLSVAEMECSNCSKIFTQDNIYIDKFWRESLSEEPMEEGKNIFVKIIDDVRFTYKLLTVQDEQDIYEYEKIYDYNFAHLYSKILLSINDNNNVFNILSKNSISKKTLNKFKRHYKKITPYIKIVTNDIICPECNFDNKIETNISVGLLPIYGESIKKMATTECVLIYEKLPSLTHNDILNMPVENRKRIYLEFSNLVKERHEQQK